MRTAQTVFVQPVQNFQLAVQGLLVPRLSRLAGTTVEDGQLAGRCRAAAVAGTSVALIFAGLAYSWWRVAWPVAQVVLDKIPKFAKLDLATSRLPMFIQGAIYLVQVPFTAAMRAMHRATLLFCQYLAFTTVSLTALVLGANWGGLARGGLGFGDRFRR